MNSCSNTAAKNNVKLRWWLRAGPTDGFALTGLKTPFVLDLKAFSR
jgi:hypothetical protein